MSYLLPSAKVINISSPRQFFKSSYKNSDAMLYFAESGSAWTLIYPSFSVVIPYPNIIKVPMVYPMPKDDAQWMGFVNSWLIIKKDDGTIKNMFQHWIEGEGANVKEKRWSIIKDVLKWTN